MLDINATKISESMIGSAIEQSIDYQLKRHPNAKKIIVSLQISRKYAEKSLPILAEEDKNVFYRTINDNPNHLLILNVCSTLPDDFMIIDSACIELYSTEELREKEQKLKWNNFALVSNEFLEGYIFPFIKAIRDQLPDKKINKIIVRANEEQLKLITTTDEGFTCIMPNDIELEFVYINESDFPSKHSVVLIPIFDEEDED